MVTYEVSYNKMWKWLNKSNWTVDNVFGNDFNFNEDWDLLNTSTTAELIANTTTSYNLSWFQAWNEVLAYAFRVVRDDAPAPAYTQYRNMNFLRSSDWNSWESSWADYWMSFNRNAIEYWYWSWSWHAYYVWVDDDEIRDWYTYYKFHAWADDWTWEVYSPTATISNLSFDSTLHTAWYIWIEWANLCYTDWTWWELWNLNKWYKHKIKYDPNYSEYVWTEYAGSIWLEPDVVRRIYYVDEYWRKRRTYEAQNRLDYPSWQWLNVWSSNRGKIWCPWNYDYADAWYWHLCFVNNTWYLMRILNWNPNE